MIIFMITDDKASVDNLRCTIMDMVSNLMYYDRKEDESLPVGEIERLCEVGATSIEEIIEMFATEMRK
jgi:hypothetical protein